MTPPPQSGAGEYIGATLGIYASIAYPNAQPYINQGLANTFRNIEETTLTWTETGNLGTTPYFWSVSPWTSVADAGTIGNYLGTQGWYNMAIAVDPYNTQIGNNSVNGALTAPGQYLSVSGVGANFTPGPLLGVAAAGTAPPTAYTWTNIPVGNGLSGLHGDAHAMQWDINAARSSNNILNSQLLFGNDGGIWRYDLATGDWFDINGNLAITTFNGLATSPSDPGVALGGAQDNGTELSNNNLGWQHVDDGDGGLTAIDQKVPSNAYHVLNGTLRYSSDGGNTWPSTIFTDKSLYFSFVAKTRSTRTG